VVRRLDVSLLNPGVVIKVPEVLRRDRLLTGAASGDTITRLHDPKANERTMRAIFVRRFDLSRT